MSATTDPLAKDVITQDLACAHCSYNLRTLSPASLCPECGTPAIASIQRLDGSSLNFVRMGCGAFIIAFAVWLQVYGLSAAVWLVGTLFPTIGYFGWYVLTWVVPELCRIAMIGAAICLLGSARYRKFSNCRACRICVYLAGIILLVQIATNIAFWCTKEYSFGTYQPPFPLSDILKMALHFAFALQIVLAIISCVYIRDLGADLHRVRLSTAIALVMAICALGATCNLLLSLTSTILHVLMTMRFIDRAPCIQFWHFCNRVEDPIQWSWSSIQIATWLAIAIAAFFFKRKLAVHSTPPTM
jgi:hypothetical protein